jgi:hypothetical protein
VKTEERYKSFSRFTDPKDHSAMLDQLPQNALGIADAAKQLTIHHNLLAYFGVPNTKWKQMKRVWPPRVRDLLHALGQTGPGDLYGPRQPEQRIIGACMMESHLLAGMLRYRQIAVKIRAGYFKDVYVTDPEHTVMFWENALRERNVEGDLLKENPQKWKEEIDQFTRGQIDNNHYIEHWLCEYWDPVGEKWRLLDANDTFLQAHSNIEVGYQLPEKHFEYAWEAWQKMRKGDGFNPDQYAEEPQDGRSHIRSQMLWDYFSLLNHDIAGYDEPTQEALHLIKKRTYDELSPLELEELDMLAALLSRGPTVEELVSFYRQSTTLRLENVEKDPYSFVFSGMSQ